MKFVLWAPSFDDRSGGAIALHLLCQRLNEAGQTAMLWPASRTRLQLWRNLRKYLGWVRYRVMRRERSFDRGPFAAELASPRDLRDAVVVYPEIVAGNPLKARHVVRWLLHRPGFHTGQAVFGAEDLLFFYQDAFHDAALGDYAKNRLTLTWWNEAYFDRGMADRSGSAYLMKKGAGRVLEHDATDSILIDGLNHEEKAAVFNRCKYFYTYDPYTLYSRYAAICGCIPIIVPVPGLDKENWVPKEDERYGLAYGSEEIPWAIDTRHLLLERITKERAEEEAMLRAFIARCRERYDDRG